MKAIFPCKGSIILNKQDVEPLEAYYKTELIRSKMYDYYKTSKDIMQVGIFTYIPQNTNIVLDKSSLLELQTLKKVLNIDVKKPERPTMKIPSINKEPPEIANEEELIDDDDILSNPFFTTLKPLD